MYNLALMTYGKNDEEQIRFTVSREFFNKTIKELGFIGGEDFITEYTYDTTESIYHNALSTQNIIHEKIVKEPITIDGGDNLYFCDDCSEVVNEIKICDQCGCEVCLDCAYTFQEETTLCPQCYYEEA